MKPEAFERLAEKFDISVGRARALVAEVEFEQARVTVDLDREIQERIAKALESIAASIRTGS